MTNEKKVIVFEDEVTYVSDDLRKAIFELEPADVIGIPKYKVPEGTVIFSEENKKNN